MRDAHVEYQDALKVDQAVELMRYDRATARRLLDEVIRNTPDQYDVSWHAGSETFVRCWTLEEFSAYVTQPEVTESHAKVRWISSAYPRALYWLAYMETENQQYEDALAHLSEALRLEPDHPEVLYEVSLVRALMGDHDRALEFREAALTSRPYMSPTSRARILRGLGVALIDHGRLDEAETRLNESLEIQPANETALTELAYIKHLRSGGGKESVVLRGGQEGATKSSQTTISAPSVHAVGDGLPHTATSSISLKCPVCSRMESAVLYPVVNVTLSPELKRPLLQQQLTRHRCGGCGTVLSFLYDLLYCDAGREIAIQLLTDNSAPGSGDRIARYALRRVATLYQLIEKVAIADSNLDDRLIELLKHEICYDLASRYSDPLAKLGISRLNPANVLFVGITKSANTTPERVDFLLLLNGSSGFNVLRLSAPVAAISDVANRLRRVTPLEEGGWHAIDFAWADGVLANESIPVNVEMTMEPRFLQEHPIAGAISNAWNEQVQAVQTREKRDGNGIPFSVNS